MELYMEEKLKLMKKGSRNCASRREPEARASVIAGAVRPPRSFTSRCANLVREQRARFYIMRRCVTMLICWRDYP
ncbi:hypothetical protein AXF42_Ash019094 [Apostasia shenzhenica]|uniref:ROTUNDIFOLIA like 8 n=1 Tax=Apostasia shenzhenica TaxID=1088818 RepID=A0A2I0AAA0_9ASPA|nr:hypothetical protein AXF42_Ash019094 [Apostasia shenzhenica]